MQDAAASGPVTVCVRQHVKPGRQREFEAWLEGVEQAAAQFAGHQGLNLVSVALVLLMTYAVMPRLTRLFARWLFPVTAQRP